MIASMLARPRANGCKGTMSPWVSVSLTSRPRENRLFKLNAHAGIYLLVPSIAVIASSSALTAALTEASLGSPNR